MPSVVSVAVVGAQYPNEDKSNRRFFIMLCNPGDPMDLVPEPQNPHDRNAIAVFTMSGGQVGYVNAERAAWLSGQMRQGRPISAIFQSAMTNGCIIRIAFDGLEPTLPERRDRAPQRPTSLEEDVDFWPDYIPPDD